MLILDKITAEEVCTTLTPFWTIIGYILFAIKIIVPLLLIVTGMIRFGKSIMAENNDDIEKSKSIFIKKLIAAVAVFLVIQLVSLVMGLINDDNSWKKCAKCVFHPFTDEQCGMIIPKTEHIGEGKEIIKTTTHYECPSESKLSNNICIKDAKQIGGQGECIRRTDRFLYRNWVGGGCGGYVEGHADEHLRYCEYYGRECEPIEKTEVAVNAINCETTIDWDSDCSSPEKGYNFEYICDVYECAEYASGSGGSYECDEGWSPYNTDPSKCYKDATLVVDNG